MQPRFEDEKLEFSTNGNYSVAIDKNTINCLLESAGSNKLRPGGYYMGQATVREGYTPKSGKSPSEMAKY
jgi:hypothetical protein